MSMTLHWNIWYILTCLLLLECISYTSCYLEKYLRLQLYGVKVLEENAGVTYSLNILIRFVDMYGLCSGLYSSISSMDVHFS